MEAFPRPWQIPFLGYVALQQQPEPAADDAARAPPRDLDHGDQQVAPVVNQQPPPPPVQRQQPRALDHPRPPIDPQRRRNALLDIHEENILPVRLRPRPQAEGE